jgi:hypothetical protein
VGTGDLGLLVVMAPAPDNRIYAAGVATGVYNKAASYPVLPYGASGNTTVTVPAVNGSLTLPDLGHFPVVVPTVGG